VTVADDDFADLADVIESLAAAEERLRDAAYDRLRAVADGDESARGAERRLEQARRAVERARRALGAGVDDGA
jgi:hypothetical protein